MVRKALPSWLARYVAASTSSLLQKPDRSGKPASASAPHRNVAWVIGITRRRPLKRRMSMTLPIACITLPEARNNSALKKACVKRWNRAATTAKVTSEWAARETPLPSARNM